MRSVASCALFLKQHDISFTKSAIKHACISMFTMLAMQTFVFAICTAGLVKPCLFADATSFIDQLIAINADGAAAQAQACCFA